MRHVSFALILVILSFGLSFGQAGTLVINAVPTTGFYGSGPTINTGTLFEIEIYAEHQAPGIDRLAWSVPFHFYGTSGVTTINGGAGSFVQDPTFEAVWNYGWFTHEESWDGDLTTGNTTLGPGDHHNTTGITGGWASGSGVMLVGTYTFGGFTDIDGSVLGTFCMAQGDMDNNTFDWLLDPPSPSFATVCWDVQKQPNGPPEFTNCPGTAVTMQWHEQYSFDLSTIDDFDNDNESVDLIDPSGFGSAAITVAGNPGGVVHVEFNPDCTAVGSKSITVSVGDAANPAPNGGASECVFNFTVLNTAPTMDPGPCGQTYTVGTNESNDYTFSATDPNTGDVLVWTTNDLNATFVGSVMTYVAPATAGPVTVHVTVTDCNGDFAECDIMFIVISEKPFEIVIEKFHNQLMGHHGYINIYKQDGTELMHGFDFLIAYDIGALASLGAIKGAGIADWEFFTYRFVNNCGGSCPSGLIRVVGIADENDGPNHPPAGATLLTNGDIMFTLDFLVTSNYNYAGQFVPVNFFWMDCGDNTIAMQKRTDEAAGGHDIKTAMSYYDPITFDGGVFHYNGWNPLFPWYDVTDLYWGFPTFYGAQWACFLGADPLNPLKKPVPFIKFFGGGFDIITIEDLDDRGDVNLNGVANEIADAVVFTNYFIYGADAFAINFEGQKAATEINGDGIALTVADLVYLIRIIVGDVLPLPKVAPNVTLNVSSGEIVSIDGEIGAAQFVFAGNVNVTPLTNMEMISNYREGNTYVLVYSLDRDVTASGEILSAHGQLISVEAADYNGNAYKTSIMPTSLVVKSFPNPFNPVATISMDLPIASDWTITIYNVVGQKVTQFSGFDQQVNVKWDASNEASGIYFYKAEAGNSSVTKKMVLLK